MKHFTTKKQQTLFKELESAGKLVFACGPKGAVANLVGEFKVRRNHHDDDQLDVDDGTCHVHIDWARVKRCEVSNFHGEGLLIFFDGEEPLFRLYKMDGLYSEEIHQMVGSLLD